MYWLVLVVVGVILALVVNPLLTRKKKIPGGLWTALIANLVGAWLGDVVLGDWAWMLYSYNVIAGIIGAIVINYLWVLVAGKKKEASGSQCA